MSDRPDSPDPLIEALKQDIDRSLIRANLKLTPTQRIEKLIELQRVAEELRSLILDELRPAALRPIEKGTNSPH